MSLAPVLTDIATDCERTHDELVLSCLNEQMADKYFRLNVPQGMQKIVLDEWQKAREIKTCTDAYLRLNQVENDLLRCIQLVRAPTIDVARSNRQLDRDDGPGAGGVLRITQGDYNQSGANQMRGGNAFQGNFAGCNINSSRWPI